MDFERLFGLLPKEPTRWSSEDVVTWLHFIGLEGLAFRFVNASIDGSCLGTLESADLEHELEVKSLLSRKKLLKWIQEGLHAFEKYVENKKKAELLAPSPEGMLMRRAHTSMMRDRVYSAHQQAVSPFEVDPQCVELFITPYEGQNASFFVVNKTSMIGKCMNHPVSVYEDTVDRDHARIVVNNNNFFLEDMGSRAGTYVRISQRTELTTNMIIEMGSYLFVVSQLSHTELVLLYSMTNDDVKDITITSAVGTKGFSIGRKQIMGFSLEDQHMSTLHSKISYIMGKFVIEDMSSTNGTWIRLSKPEEPSHPCRLTDGTVFKIGATSTYTCRFKSKMEIETPKFKPKQCTRCNRPETDALLVPCHHNVTCFDCARTLRECPVCYNSVKDCIKIYN